ncbi:ATP-binding protein [Phycisphaeraceae bacterium D3-23]
MVRVREVATAASILGTLIVMGCASSACLPAAATGGLLVGLLQNLSFGAAGNEVHQLINAVFRKQTSRKDVMINHDIHALVGKAILYVLEGAKSDAKGTPASQFYRKLIKSLTARWSDYNPTDEFSELTDEGIPAYFSDDHSGRLDAIEWVKLLTVLSQDIQDPGKEEYLGVAGQSLQERFAYTLLQLTKADFAPGETKSEFGGKAFAGVKLAIIKEITGQLSGLDRAVNAIGIKQDATHSDIKRLNATVLRFVEQIGRDIVAHRETLIKEIKAAQDQQTEVLMAELYELTGELAQVLGTILTRLTQHNEQQQAEHLKLNDELRAMRSEIRTFRAIHFHHPDDVGLVSPLMQIVDRSGDSSANPSLHYKFAWDAFVGRDELVQELIHGFLAFDAPRHEQIGFSWTLVYGKAGSGKSRLALELVREACSQYEDILPRSGYCGNGLPAWWGAIKKENLEDTLRRDELRRWDLDGPALMVIDYAGMSVDLLAALTEFKKLSHKYKQMVRVLLLDRRNDSEEIERLSKQTHGLIGSMYMPETSRASDRFGIQLEPLKDDEDVVEIMVNRIKSRRPLRDHETPQWLLKQLDTIDDSGQRRPLFAGMVGQIFASEVGPGNNGSDDWLTARSELLDSVIELEESHWKQHKEFVRSVYRQHKNLLALSTGCRGVPICVHDELATLAPSEVAKVGVPNLDSRNLDLFERMCSPGAAADAYGILEPDIIGEWFTLRQLQANETDSIRLDAFVEIAWKVAPQGVSDFIFMCVQDHAMEVDRLGIDNLLPPAGDSTLEVVRLLRDVLRELLNILAETSVAKEEAPDLASGAVVGFAKKVFHLLQDRIDSAGCNAADDDALIGEISESAMIYINIILWLESAEVRTLTRKDYEETRSALDKPGMLAAANATSGRRRNRAAFARAMGYAAFSKGTSVPFDTQGRTTSTDETLAGHLDAASNSLARSSSADEPREKGRPSGIVMDQGTIVSAFGRGRRRHLAPRDAGIKFGSQPIYRLAGKLLEDAAQFFRNLAEQNEKIEKEMQENADVFVKMAKLIGEDPIGIINEKSHSELASRLLQDSAKFFETLADQNPPISKQMRENANVYRHIGDLVAISPLGEID